jgi:hypothetical protein
MGSGQNWFRMGWNYDSSVNTVTGLQAERPENGKWTLGRKRDFYFLQGVQTCSGAHPAHSHMSVGRYFSASEKTGV